MIFWGERRELKLKITLAFVYAESCSLGFTLKISPLGAMGFSKHGSVCRFGLRVLVVEGLRVVQTAQNSHGGPSFPTGAYNLHSHSKMYSAHSSPIPDRPGSRK